jgi:hypothetical protein
MGICPSADGGSISCPSADGQSELQISAANAGAKPAKCTSAANAHRRVLGHRYFFNLFFICSNSLSFSLGL